MPNLASLLFFIPELILSAVAVALFIFALIPDKEDKKWGYASVIAIAGLLASLFFVLKNFNIGSPPLFWGLLVLDKPAAFFKVIFIITALVVIILSQKSKELSEGANDSAEYYSLLVGSVLGMNLLASANNLLMIYLALEFVSLMSYILVGFARGSVRSSEAALKYVLYGAVASGIFLYGASLYYGQTGTLDIFSNVLTYQHTNVLAGLFILAGFLYKIAAVPMHAWCPDAYEGAPTPITAFLSVAPKAAGFAVLMRVFGAVGIGFNWPIIIAVLSAVTMTFGNLVAIPQTNVKRLLAYSSIAHAGYLLMGVASGTPRGAEAVYFYFAAYLVMNLGAFLVVQIIADVSPPLMGGDRGEGGRESLDIYKGLGRRGASGTILGIAMTIFLLSLTGVPPFAGFIGKFYIFAAVLDAKIYWLAFVGIANSVVSLYYYMRIVKTIFFDEPADAAQPAISSRRLAAVLGILSFATIFIGLCWQWLSNIVAAVIV
jgi:NADH-quinone oxidoreductase subunit N